jgi:hypothetical protein
MLVVTEGADSESHWNDTARELLCGLLIYVAGLSGERPSMAELRRLVVKRHMAEIADKVRNVLPAVVRPSTAGFGSGW